jgi:RNA polymerase sigma factor (sigma-70 family)
MHDLAARLARGDETAFAELYDACANGLHHYLAGRLGSREAASDVLQSAFLRAVKSRRRFWGVENPVAYMFQVARNEALRAAKKQRVIRSALSAAELFAAAGEIESDQEDAEVVAVALSRLDADDREIIELKIFAGLAFREIADVVGMPQSTVATRYRRALESLRGWLAKQFR